MHRYFLQNKPEQLTGKRHLAPFSQKTRSDAAASPESIRTVRTPCHFLAFRRRGRRRRWCFACRNVHDQHHARQDMAPDVSPRTSHIDSHFCPVCLTSLIHLFSSGKSLQSARKLHEEKLLPPVCLQPKFFIRRIANKEKPPEIGGFEEGGGGGWIRTIELIEVRFTV